MLSFARKIGGWFLAFLLFGLPLLNCALQAQAMTAAEKECCKKMAGQCGRAGMAQSHSCCPPNGSVDDRPILKAVPHVSTNFTLSIVEVVPQTKLVASLTASLPLFDSLVHGPPGETPPNTTVLRI